MPYTPTTRKWRSRAAAVTIPTDLPVQVMNVATMLDAALITPDAVDRAAALRYVLDQIDAVTNHVRAAARQAQGQALAEAQADAR